ncbi:GNAT family N-acetyltransferase [Enterococcus sp. DIV0876]|uniref:GNAT family N-acetyltransferase n=1 Tax=Enterococcus sp. DIV0876 TaxID=2774633 RepID=UPI003D2FAC48
MKEIILRPITKGNIAELWAVSYGPLADLEWMNWDGPYFQEPILTWEEFRTGFGKSCIDNPLRNAIYADNRLIGIVSAYWEDNDLHQWLEFGIAIYDPQLWNQGVGTQAIKQWVSYLFALEPNIQRIGYTTWSGNHRMMKLGEKLGMTKEAQIRKVRYWQDHYYDSVKYGVLREEWQQKR